MSSSPDPSASPLATPRRTHKKIIIVLLLLAIICGISWYRLLPNHFPTRGEVFHLDSLPEDFPVFYFESKTEPVKAVVLIGSGDGGWSYWEEKVCQHLTTLGCAVVGWDTR